MKILTYILSGFLMVCGLGSIAMPLAIFASPRELSALSWVLACIVCVIAIGLVATGTQHIRKKEKETALAVATTSGFVAWIILNSQVSQLTKNRDGHVWQIGALVLTIAVCYYGTKALKNSIRRNYKK